MRNRTLFGTVVSAMLTTMASCVSAPQHNTLTKAEIADGWQLLFDGNTLNGWRDYNGDSLTQPWHVVDGCIQANENNGLTLYSMALGEQITTISKDEVISKIGTITDDKNKRMVDKVCFNSLFFGTDYKLEEVMA